MILYWAFPWGELSRTDWVGDLVLFDLEALKNPSPTAIGPSSKPCMRWLTL